MAKPLLRIKARNLREKKGLSIKEIESLLGASRGTVSLWCRDIRLTPEQIKRLEEKEKSGRVRGQIKASEKHRKNRLKKVAKIHKKANKDIGKLSRREVRMIGAALYWAEGSKKERSLSFANSDPEMIKFYIFWLTRICEVSPNRIKCSVGINQVHQKREKEVKKYWSTVTGIPIAQFNKTSFKKVNNKKSYRNFKRHYGTLSVRVLKGTDLYYLTLGWIKALKQSWQGSSVG